MLKRLILSLVLLITLAATGTWFAAWHYQKPGPLTQPVTFNIPKGSGSVAIARQLKTEQVISSQWAFVLASHAPRGGSLKAGEYAFASGASLKSVIALLQSGQVIVHHLTIPEGLTNFQIAALLEAEPALTGNVNPLPPEGHLLPDTYNFLLGETRSALLGRMKNADAAYIAAAWSKRDPTQLKNPEEAIVLASIVEKETGVESERPKVAAVFLNRLKLGMKLQADPTIIYALANGQGPIERSLTHQDLAITSPYNTYTQTGLPPTPICNPGRAAIDAVLHPAIDDNLYFVATGEGQGKTRGHVFAATLEQHNRNVAQWLNYLHTRSVKE